MKRRIFLTGPIGCGKSTILLRALGPENLHRAGGLLTVRRRRADGSPADFVLMDPSGKEKQVFLDLTGAFPRLDMGVFSGLGAELLSRAAEASFVILDEIGGIELLCPEFMAELDKLLASDVPIMGVLKGEGPASAMIAHLGLTKEYEEAARSLRNRLARDDRASIYHCDQFDTPALLPLAEHWVKEYAHE